MGFFNGFAGLDQKAGLGLGLLLQIYHRLTIRSVNQETEYLPR
jgi:hypothetical protein